jgi:hypothetical protein
MRSLRRKVFSRTSGKKSDLSSTILLWDEDTDYYEATDVKTNKYWDWTIKIVGENLTLSDLSEK